MLHEAFHDIYDVPLVCTFLLDLIHVEVYHRLQVPFVHLSHLQIFS